MLGRQKLADLDEVKNSDSERILENRLHGRVTPRIQVAIQCGAGKKARDGDRTLSVGRYPGNSYLQCGLGRGFNGEKRKTEYGKNDDDWTHGFVLALILADPLPSLALSDR